MGERLGLLLRDEGDVYGEGDEYYESHCGFYDIRDICRIDPDIVPLSEPTLRYHADAQRRWSMV